jgi:mono/diheme cytochrome c family protein
MRASNVVTLLRTVMLAGLAACGVAARGKVELVQSQSLITPGLVATGDSLFHARACRRCHGVKGAGTRNGPTLADSAWLQIDGSYAEIVRIITEGVPMSRIRDSTHTLEMHPRGGLQNPLNDDQIKAVAAYVYSLRSKLTTSP